MDKINRLYTYMNTYKSLELLGIYLDKITNGKSTHLKFIDDYDITALDLLLTAIKYKSIKKIDNDKLDRKELNYYIKKGKGITYFKKQNKVIKDKGDLVKYLVSKLNEGDYYYTLDNIVRVGNIIVNINWLTEFSEFLVNSYYLEQFISDDRKLFSYLIGNKGNYYEYIISKSNKQEISYHEELYLYDILKNITKYDFSEVKVLNSTLQKEGYILSLNKTNKNKRVLSNDYYYVLLKYNNEMYELLRSIAHAYNNKYSVTKCRKLFTIKDKKYIDLIYNYALYYLEYLYDYKYVSKYLDYDSINTLDINPTIIDYTCKEYKNVLNKLNKKRKEIIRQNKVVDICLRNDFRDIEVLKDKGYKLSREANRLCMLVNAKKELAKTMAELTKLDERSNKVLIDYISKGIFSASYRYRNKELEITLYENDKIVFGLEITIDMLNELLKNEDNLVNRIRVYEKG